MGVQERRARERQELRGEILEAARELFVREGIDQVSMRRIAEKIEYSPTTIYLYFKDKAELIDCLCEETLGKLDRRLTQIESSTPDPVERLRRGMKAYVEFGLKHPNEYKVAFMTELKPDELAGGRAKAMGQNALNHTRSSLKQCVADGRMHVEDVEAAAQNIWATIHGLTSLLIVKTTFPWADRTKLLEQLVDTHIAGLMAERTVPVP
jgi:AcrR family transcriptional regulator